MDFILCIALAGIVLAAIRMALWKIADSMEQRKKKQERKTVDIRPFVPVEDIPDGVDYCFNPDCGNVVPEGRMYCPECEKKFRRRQSV